MHQCLGMFCFINKALCSRYFVHCKEFLPYSWPKTLHEGFNALKRLHFHITEHNLNGRILFNREVQGKDNIALNKDTL